LTVILRNLTTDAQVVRDGVLRKEVSPQGLVSVSHELGFQLLSEQPKIWLVEEPLLLPATPPVS
jgi:hypothetical protein